MEFVFCVYEGKIQTYRGRIEQNFDNLRELRNYLALHYQNTPTDKLILLKQIGGRIIRDPNEQLEHDTVYIILADRGVDNCPSILYY